eukprot:scaffold78296_cov52-Phaeocystis_antarctica.AAC.2
MASASLAVSEIPHPHPHVSSPQISLLDQAARAWRRPVCPPRVERAVQAPQRVLSSSCVFAADLASTRALVRRRREPELEEPHRDPPAPVGVPVVRERADLEVFAGCGRRPFSGRPVVGERVRGAVVP